MTKLATYSDMIAAEIAADAAHYLLTMYPHATPEKSPSMLRSLRAHIAMDVAAAMRISTSAEARAWIDRRQRHRREINRLRKLGDQAEVVRGDAAAVDVLIDQMMAPQEIDYAGGRDAEVWLGGQHAAVDGLAAALQPVWPDIAARRDGVPMREQRLSDGDGERPEDHLGAKPAGRSGRKSRRSISR